MQQEEGDGYERKCGAGHSRPFSCSGYDELIEKKKLSPCNWEDTTVTN